MKLNLYKQLEELYQFAESPVKRIGTGLRAVDELVVGPAPGEVCMIMGRSYSGKSIVGQQIVHANPTLPSIFFSMEMPRNQALLRMYAMWTNTSASEVQMMMENGRLPDDVWDLAIAYPKHTIVDQRGITLYEMTEVVEAFEAEYDERPAFVVVDYLELLGGAKQSGEGYIATEQQATQLKDWAGDQQMRVFVLHQTNRQERQWMPPTEDSARNAGYTEADIVIGMWRPHKDPALSYYDKMAMEHIVHMNVLKNRPFFKEADKLEFYLQDSLRLEDKYEYHSRVTSGESQGEPRIRTGTEPGEGSGSVSIQPESTYQPAIGDSEYE